MNDEQTVMNTKHWLIRPSTVRLLWRLFIITLAVLVIADYWIHWHSSFGIEGTFGFFTDFQHML